MFLFVKEEDIKKQNGKDTSINELPVDRTAGTEYFHSIFSISEREKYSIIYSVFILPFFLFSA